MTTVKVHLSDLQADALRKKAASEGISLEEWFQRVAERESPSAPSLGQTSLRERMQAIRARVKPDPDGWSVRDYVNVGRR